MLRTALFVCFAAIATATRAQSDITLRIGDAAPELHYAKWIKGTPVKQYEKDRLYVMEFWATWCGPCKAAMPHLSELSAKYKDKATFVGVNVWEKTGDKPYESSLPDVTRFVESIGDKMSYNVVADNNEQYMAKKWMTAAGQNGIPSTFLIQEGKIIWIGHPIKLDSIIGLVLSGRYDMAGTKKAFDERLEKSAAESKRIRAAMAPIDSAIKAKDYAKSFQLMDKLVVEFPIYDISMKYRKFGLLLDNIGADSAMRFAKAVVQKTPYMGAYFAQMIIEKEGLSKDVYLYAIEQEKEMLKTDGVVTPMVYATLAQGYARAGDYKNAVAMQEAAVQDAKVAVKEGKWLGTILDYTVTDYEKKLSSYKSQLN